MNKIQIEIDLDDILYDVGEYNERVPIETTTDCVKRQLKSKIVEEIKSQYLAEFKNTLFNQLLSDIKCQCLHEAKTKIPELLEQALTAKYETKDRWGGKGQETSFMEEFVKELQNQMVYKKCSYDSDKNTYTKLVDNTVNELTKQWKADFENICFRYGYSNNSDKEKILFAKIKTLTLRTYGKNTDLKIDKPVFDIKFELIKE